jgi:hypothetical protein
MTHSASNALKIRWENRFRGDRNKACKVTVDGTDFRINEPSPFNRKWFSHKFNGPGVRYEIAVCIQTGDIVWIYGPFACGRWPDMKIFKSKLINKLLPGEKVEADMGYNGDKVRKPNDYFSHNEKKAKKRARARHETVNRRLKQWGCLNQKWRHGRQKHELAFAAVAACTQLCFDVGEVPFQCAY